MLLKAIVHWWANSKIEREEAHTKSLIRELDRAKVAATKRIQAQKGEYSRSIKAHQEKRNEQLKAHIDFMNEQLQITAGYLPELNQFQSFTYTCLDSWMYVDLCQQEIDIVSQKISVVVTTIGLIDAYISELNKLSQRQRRHSWCEFTAARGLTVTNEFVEKTNDRINRTLKSNHHEFNNELRRLQSHRNALHKEEIDLRTERTDLIRRKKMLDKQHAENKKALSEMHESCAERWHHIAKKFEVYYALRGSTLKHVNEWLADLEEGGTLFQVIGTANEFVKIATEAFRDLNDEYQPYKHRVKAARDSNEYPDTFANDNAQRKRLAPMVTAAFENRKALIEARSLLYTRRDELRGYIDRIKPLHPDAAIDAMCEMLNADREFNNWLAFGINTSKQKREHWEKQQHRIENAAAN